MFSSVHCYQLEHFNQCRPSCEYLWAWGASADRVAQDPFHASYDIVLKEDTNVWRGAAGAASYHATATMNVLYHLKPWGVQWGSTGKDGIDLPFAIGRPQSSAPPSDGFVVVAVVFVRLQRNFAKSNKSSKCFLISCADKCPLVPLFANCNRTNRGGPRQNTEQTRVYIACGRIPLWITRVKDRRLYSASRFGPDIASACLPVHTRLASCVRERPNLPRRSDRLTLSTLTWSQSDNQTLQKALRYCLTSKGSCRGKITAVDLKEGLVAALRIGTFLRISCLVVGIAGAYNSSSACAGYCATAVELCVNGGVR